MVKVSFADGHCNATGQMPSYMHTCKDKEEKGTHHRIERAFGSVTRPDDADEATAFSVTPRIIAVGQEEEGA